MVHNAGSSGIQVLLELRKLLPPVSFETYRDLEEKLKAPRIAKHEGPHLLITEVDAVRKTISLSGIEKKEKDRLLSDKTYAEYMVNIYLDDLRWKQYFVTTRGELLKMSKLQLDARLRSVYQDNWAKLDQDGLKSSRRDTRPGRPSGRPPTRVTQLQTAPTSQYGEQCKTCERHGRMGRHPTANCRLEGGAQEEWCTYCKKYGHGTYTPCTLAPSKGKGGNLPKGGVKTPGSDKGKGGKGGKDGGKPKGSLKPTSYGGGGKPSNPKANTVSFKQDGACFFCGESGHVQANCAKKWAQKLGAKSQQTKKSKKGKSAEDSDSE